MYEFQPTQRQSQAIEFLRYFSESEVRPVALEAERRAAWPESLLLELRRRGIAISQVPREYAGIESANVSAFDDASGGESQAHRGACLAAEELAWGDASVLASVPGPGLGGAVLERMGTRWQLERFFSPFRERTPRWAACALTEGGAADDIAAIRTRCVQQGDDWQLDGVKRYVSNGARASWTVVFATQDAAQGLAGLRAFVVEQGTPGLRIARKEPTLGLRAWETTEIALESCVVSGENLLGGEPFYADPSNVADALAALDATRPMLGATAIGVGRAALERAIDHIRHAFLRGTTSSLHTSLAEHLARARRRLDAARLLCWRASWAADLGDSNARDAAMCRLEAPRAALEATRAAIEVAGAVGLESDGFLEKWLRDLLTFEVVAGPAAAQQRALARILLGSDSA